MKFNQVAALAAATLIIPAIGTFAHLKANTEVALAESGQPALLAQDTDAPAPENADAPEKREGKGWGDQYLEQLDLTEAQKAEIEKIRQDARGNSQGRREEMRALRDKMQQLYASDASSAELRNQHQEAMKLRQEVGDQHFETKLKIREVLTLEQRQKLVELKSQRRERRGPRGPQSFNF
jgi:periplasmic protein CpxP/Spy